MKKLSRKIFTCLLTAVMLFSTAPFMGIGLTAKADGTGDKGPQMVYSGDYTIGIADDGTGYIFSYDGNETDLTIPATIAGYSIFGIYVYAFAECKTLKSVIISDGITEIGEYAFWDCSNLKTVIMPNSVKSIDDCAFRGCNNLKTIELSNTLTEIGAYAFDNCTNLESIKLPDSIKSIGSYAFYACESLKSINFPSGLKSVTGWIVPNCDRLTNIIIEDGIVEIKSAAFADSTGLKEITIPKSVKTIENFAFFIGDYINKDSIKDFVIRGYRNTVAEKYAEEVGCKFIAIDEHEHDFYKFSSVDATCTSVGSVKYLCSICNENYIESIPKTNHTDNNNDSICDTCNEKLPISSCNHICHKGGISKIFYKIALFFWKLFNTNKTCSCGINHY